VASWPRYPRDLDGAWHAIDDLRDQVEIIRVRAGLLWRLVAVLAVVAAVAAALAAWLNNPPAPLEPVTTTITRSVP